jgi:hypothetical protein
LDEQGEIMEDPKLEYVRTIECKQDPENPNLMTKQQTDALKSSIEKYGNLQPIIIDQDNNILDGSHRLAAYIDLKLETIPALRIQINGDVDKRIIRQTMNKLHGKHDLQKDAEEFIKILQANREKDLFKISNISESDFYKTIGKNGRNENQDIIPDPPENPITQKGDIWQLGEHRLLCGDSTRELDVSALMKDGKAHIFLTDPPYGVDYSELANKKTGNKNRKDIKGDELKEIEYNENLIKQGK